MITVISLLDASLELSVEDDEFLHIIFTSASLRPRNEINTQHLICNTLQLHYFCIENMTNSNPRRNRDTTESLSSDEMYAKLT